jgi:transcriptional regulator
MSVFNQFDHQDVRDLIAEYPLAWVCARNGAAEHASLLPLLGEYDENGRLIKLIGHLSRGNPLYTALTADPRALVLFRGPEGYISPADAGDRNWAPTWNYAQLRIEAEVSFEAISTKEAVTALTDTMESARPHPWEAAELGARYSLMTPRIIGFRAGVSRLCGKFKLGQDESLEILRAILANVREPALARWMKRFNMGR